MALLLCATPAPAEQADPTTVPAHSPRELPEGEAVLPLELVDVDLVEKLGEQAELNLQFTDASGHPVVLADYFDGQVPVILNLTYFRCPMACPAILQNLADSLRQTKLEPGQDYRVITVSIDPTDTVAAALQKQQATLDTLRTLKPEADHTAWPFLVGSAANSRALADSVGYGYKYLPGPRQYTHRDVIIVLSPDGTITRYLAGRTYPKVPLELTLVEASAGKIGSPVDHFKLLFCYYDTGENKYALRARRIMTAGGALTLVALSGVLGLLWVREFRKGKTNAQEAEAQA